MYASLHANPAFCEMAFGNHFPVRVWTDDEIYKVIQTHDILRCWIPRGMKNFAAGLYTPADVYETTLGRGLIAKDQNHAVLRIVEGDEYELLAGLDGQFLHTITWIGYAGVRDATTTSIPMRAPEDPPLPC
jgi:hypothetical protein